MNYFEFQVKAKAFFTMYSMGSESVYPFTQLVVLGRRVMLKQNERNQRPSGI